MRIALDFDGVLHSDLSASGSRDYIPDEPVPDAFERLKEMADHPDVEQIYIYSLRCGGQHGIQAMGQWINQHYLGNIENLARKIQFSYVKPHADIFIDDRAVQFKGDWSDPQFSLENILKFKSWNR